MLAASETPNAHSTARRWVSSQPSVRASASPGSPRDRGRSTASSAGSSVTLSSSATTMPPAAMTPSSDTPT